MQTGENRLARKLFTVAAFSISIAGAATDGIPPNGYYANKANADREYASYLRIKDGAGFYCFLDGKSSFLFEIKGDSITTPMNGMDEIVWYPGSGDVQINGEEKGQAYHDRFAFLTASAYPAVCVEEEKAITGTTAIRRARATQTPLRAWKYPPSDWLGRILKKSE